MYQGGGEISMIDEYGKPVLQAAGIGLGIVGINAAMGHFGFGAFLGDLPQLAETIVYGGAALGAVDNILWSATGEGLGEMLDIK